MTYYSWRKPHYNEEELEIVRNFFTDTEWKAIEESMEIDSIYLKIHNLFKKFHQRKLMTLTKIEMQQLTDEFIHFQINQMTREEMASYVYNSMRQEVICQRNHLSLQESLKEQIDEYEGDFDGQEYDE